MIREVSLLCGFLSLFARGGCAECKRISASAEALIQYIHNIYITYHLSEKTVSALCLWGFRGFGLLPISRESLLPISRVCCYPFLGSSVTHFSGVPLTRFCVSGKGILSILWFWSKNLSMRKVYTLCPALDGVEGAFAPVGGIPPLLWSPVFIAVFESRSVGAGRHETRLDTLRVPSPPCHESFSSFFSSFFTKLISIPSTSFEPFFFVFVYPSMSPKSVQYLRIDSIF